MKKWKWIHHNESSLGDIYLSAKAMILCLFHEKAVHEDQSIWGPWESTQGHELLSSIPETWMAAPHRGDPDALTYTPSWPTDWILAVISFPPPFCITQGKPTPKIVRKITWLLKGLWLSACSTILPFSSFLQVVSRPQEGCWSSSHHPRTPDRKKEGNGVGGYKVKPVRF